MFLLKTLILMHRAMIPQFKTTLMFLADDTIKTTLLINQLTTVIKRVLWFILMDMEEMNTWRSYIEIFFLHNN